MTDLLAQLRAYGEQLEADQALAPIRPDTGPEPPFERRPRHDRRWWPLAVAAALVVVLMASLSLIAAVDDDELPADRPDPVSPPGPAADWLMFEMSRDDRDSDIYRVRAGAEPVPVTGAATAGIGELCPTLSPTGDRLAYVQWPLNAPLNGPQPVELVIAVLDADGDVAETTVFPWERFEDPMFCPSWSPNGREIAYWQNGRGVRVLDIASGETASVSGLAVDDLEWSPDGERLALSAGDIWVYARSADEWIHETTLASTGRASELTWSGDGTRIAYFRHHGDKVELAVVNTGGGASTVLRSGFESYHGVGPVWSPTRDEIVYQRVCGTVMTAEFGEVPCRERHEVVIVAPDGTEAVLPHLLLPGSEVGEELFPYGVTWTPDGNALLYRAWSEPTDELSQIGGGLVLRPVHSADDPVLLVGAGYSGERFEPWARRP